MSRRKVPRFENRQAFYAAVQKGDMCIADIVRGMRSVTEQTQPEFAKFVGISLQALKEIEQGTANPTVETLNKIGKPFRFCVGFVRSDAISPPRRTPKVTTVPNGGLLAELARKRNTITSLQLPARRRSDVDAQESPAESETPGEMPKSS